MYKADIPSSSGEGSTQQGRRFPSTEIRHLAVGLALRAIDRRYADQALCLKSVAAEIQCSVWHLGRLLRRESGHGFTAHLRRRRTQAAQVLLGDSALPLKAIAAQCGFATASQFSRQFAGEAGLTPTAFRRLAHGLTTAPEMTSERPCEPRTAVDNR